MPAPPDVFGELRRQATRGQSFPGCPRNASSVPHGNARPIRREGEMELVNRGTRPGSTVLPWQCDAIETWDKSSYSEGAFGTPV